MKHTKGEWKATNNGSSVNPSRLISGDKGIIICLAPEYYEQSIADWGANAKLIAAAPDLLKSAKRIVKRLDAADADTWWIDDEIDAIEEAIKKATE